MSKELLLSENEIKDSLRAFYKEKRQGIKKNRRDLVESEVLERLYPKLLDFEIVLSFASMPVEISTKLLNRKLCNEKRLALPKIVGATLSIYKVRNLEDLKKSSFGVFEPTNEHEEVDFDKLGAILVPGLAFDSVFHRLGYGKGHYDRLLSKNLKAVTIGIGFEEQLCEDLLPVAKHDVKLADVMLF